MIQGGDCGCGYQVRHSFVHPTRDQYGVKKRRLRVPSGESSELDASPRKPPLALEAMS